MTARRSQPRQAELGLQIPEGVHLRMPAAIYEDADALDAGDLRLLYWDATSWWAQSRHNEHRRVRRRQQRHYHRDLADALRILLTQGDAAYAAAFAIEPDDGRSDWARGRDQIRALLREKNIEIPRGDFTDATLHRLVRRHGLAHRVFEVARLEYETARRTGRRHLTEEDDRRLRFTARQIRAHKDLGPALSGGLCETAVFWRREDGGDTLLRARFDYLRRQRLFDIQRVAPAGARDIDGGIRRTIEDGDLDVSRRLLAEAWLRMAEFVAEGRVHAWDETGQRAAVLADERALLASYVAAGEPEWVWIFAQLPVDDVGAERGVFIAPRFHRAEGRLWEAGLLKIAAALESYRSFKERFALDRQWAVIDAAKELLDEDVRVRLKKELV